MRVEARRLLRERAEPTAAIMLRAGLLAALGQTTALADIASRPDSEPPPLAALRAQLKDMLQDTSLDEIEPQVWWLADPAIERAPLADRVEQAVVDCLRARPEWRTVDLLREVYGYFPDHLTPDGAVLATTIHSYAEEFQFDRLRLRPEDHIATRTAEAQAVSQLLVELGQRLGFEAIVDEQAVEWSKSKHSVYAFAIQTTAKIETLLRAETGVLVIPGGRATLLQSKLARDARLRDTHWQVLKFSSLRQAAQQSTLTLQTFQLAFGLEPPIEQPATQIQLL